MKHEARRSRKCGCLFKLLFTGVFGKQERLVLVITSRIKPEILGHVVNWFLRKRVCVYQIHRLLYEQDETV